MPVPAGSGTADSLGSLIIRDLTPGAGYRWDDRTTAQTTSSFTVLAPGRNPGDQLVPLHGPAAARGAQLHHHAGRHQAGGHRALPLRRDLFGDQPCPTVIEYSGYNVAGPTDPIPTFLSEALQHPCNDCGNPNLLPDTATAVGSVMARVSGFATVSLQMRGTGCSGGAFDLFGYPSDYDAYDAIEIVAHQAWVAHHKVGMVGISYSGLSQFPSAGTDPPGLAAIAPMSPTDDLFSTGYPGGIYNDGFAASWIDQRIDDAKAAAAYRDGQLVRLATTPVANVGQPWTYYEIDAELAAEHGRSSTCLANQALHDQSESLASLVGPQLVAPGTGPGREPSLFDRRSMIEWASHIKVPVFLSGALQDEQTGPQWPALIDAIPKTTPLFANMVNGGHIDSTDPQTISRWLEFLDIYVARKVPTDPSALADQFLDKFTGFASGVSSQAPLPAIRFTQARAAWPAPGRSSPAQTPLVRVLFDNGAGPAGPGGIQSTYSADFSSWPPAGTVETLHFGRRRVARDGRHRPPRAPRSPWTRRPGRLTSLPASGNAWVGRSRIGTGHRCRPPTASPSRPLRSRSRPPSWVRPPLDLWVRPRYRSRTSRPPSPRSGRRRARRSTSPRGSCAARTRSTGPTRRRCSPTRPTWPATPGTCRRTPTRW